MTLRSAVAAMLAVLTFAGPAAADTLSLHGVWGNRPASSGKSGGSGFKLFGGGSFLGGPSANAAYGPYGNQRYPLHRYGKPVELADGGAQLTIKPEEPALVTIVREEFGAEYGPGTVVIDTAKRKLYYVLTPELAYVYPIAVGKAGFAWTGVETVSKVVEWPEWMPPEEMRARKPYLPIKMTGGENNPLGARAIYLGQTLYRIHGTNEPRSIGTASSSGCIRMHNKHVAHLAALVSVKRTKVHVLKSLPKGTFVAWKPDRETTKPAKEVRNEQHHSL